MLAPTFYGCIRMIRIAIVTDVHHGADGPVKLGTQALRLVADFTAYCNSGRFDFAVDMGDRTNDVGEPVADLALATTISNALADITIPKHHLMGNHDAYALSIAQWESLLGQSMGHNSIDVNGYHLVFLQPDVDNRDAIPPAKYPLSAADLSWLETDLSATSLPAIVFNHVPLIPPSMVGTYWGPIFGDTGYFTDNYDDFHAIAQAHNVIACLSGHAHTTSWHMRDGIVYMTIQSLTDQWSSPPEPSGAMGFLMIDDRFGQHRVILRVTGLVPVTLVAPVRALGTDWLAP